MDLEKPDDRLTVNYKGEDRSLFMSYLRLNSCLRVLGDPERLGSLLLDPDLGESVIRVMVAPKGGAGEMFDVELEEEDLSGEDCRRIIDWVQDHLSYFFLSRFQETGKKFELLEPVAAALKSSLTGFDVSTSSEPSAGPSE